MRCFNSPGISLRDFFVCPSLAGTFDRQLIRLYMKKKLPESFVFSVIKLFLKGPFPLCLHNSSLNLWCTQVQLLFFDTSSIFTFFFLQKAFFFFNFFLYHPLPLWRGNCIAAVLKNRNYITQLRSAVTVCTRCQYWPFGALSKTNTWFDSLMLFLSKNKTTNPTEL